MVEQQQFAQRARRIRAQVSTILKRRGLLPRFKRWRLSQDAESGMIVLFGVLNNRYIAAHTSLHSADYFDPRVLHDLADELQVQVVSCNSDGPRYAFILERGQLARIPTHIEFPYVEQGKLLVRVVYSDDHTSRPDPALDAATLDDQSRVRQGVGAFLKVFDDIQLRGDAASQLSAQSVPDIVAIDEDEFQKRVAEHEANQQKKNARLFPVK